MASTLSSRIEKLVSDGRLPGVGAIAFDKTGKRLCDEAFGKINADDPSSKDYTNDTQMLMWSCTKLITSISILQLLEQGKIGSLDDAVSKYLPEQAEIQVVTSLDAEAKPQGRAQEKEMKIIHLLTHTAGYSYDFWSPLLFDYRQAKNQAQGTYVGLGTEWHFHDVFLEFDPGTKHNYGLNVDILGFIVEKLSGVDLPTYIAKNIAQPLGMKNTGTYWDNDDWLRCHIKSPEGKLTPVEAIAPAKDPYKYGGGHYMVSTLNDYSQVLLAILNEGKHPTTGQVILKPETVRNHVFKDYIPHVGCSSDGIGVVSVSLVPGLSIDGEMLKGVKKGWSAGLMINIDDIPGGRKAGSGAWAGLGNLYYWIDPTGGRAGMFGTSVLPFLDEDCVQVFEELEKIAYSEVSITGQ